MQLFECQHCGQLLYFENTRCERCGHSLGYLPELSVLSALAPEGDGRWRPLAAPDRPSRLCANAAHRACNWLVPAAGPKAFCDACGLNRTIPDLGVPAHLQRWQRLEAAKHRLVYGLLRLRLPLVGRAEAPQTGLAFDFLAGPGSGFPKPQSRGDHHRPRTRSDYDRPCRGGRCREGAPPPGHGKTLPNVARAFSPRSRPLLLGSPHPRLLAGCHSESVRR